MAVLPLSEASDIQTVKELVKHTDKLCCLKVHSHLEERSQVNMRILELVNQAGYPRRVCVFTIVVVV